MVSEPGRNERLSAFVDGELQGPARDRVVDDLYVSPELRRAWARFHLIGDAVRKTGPIPHAGSVAGNADAALPAERIVHFESRLQGRRLAPLPGLAFAAAIAGIAILGIHSLDDDGVRSPAAAGASRPDTAVAGPATTAPDAAAPHVASTAARPAVPDAIRLKWSDVAPDAEARLNAYLVNHNEYAGNGMHGVLPYVRVVGYQSMAGDYR